MSASIAASAISAWSDVAGTLAAAVTVFDAMLSVPGARDRHSRRAAH